MMASKSPNHAFLLIGYPSAVQGLQALLRGFHLLHSTQSWYPKSCRKLPQSMWSEAKIRSPHTTAATALGPRLAVASNSTHDIVSKAVKHVHVEAFKALGARMGTAALLICAATTAG
eukprot:4917572-Amphidinium_carterae.1